MTRNGICTKENKDDGSRVHLITLKYDGNGVKYESCDRCGTFFVK